MNPRHRCCRESATRFARRTPPSAIGHLRHAAEWAIPSALLVLLPKCPLCLAAYVAAFTGLGLSLSAATHLRMFVLAAILAALAMLSARGASALVRRWG